MQKRNSNIEILRIISIIMIIFSHYSVHNAVIASTLPLSFNRFLLEIVTLGDIGSIIFVLISGYCLANYTEFKLSKLFKIIFQVFFYSIIIYILFIIFKYEDFSLISLIKALFPISFKQYWFATTYIVFILLLINF